MWGHHNAAAGDSRLTVSLTSGKPSRTSHSTVRWHQVCHGGLLCETAVACSWHCHVQSETAPYAQAAVLLAEQCTLMLLGLCA